MTNYEVLFPDEKPLLYASFGKRVVAFLIDMAITAAGFFLLLALFQFTRILLDLDKTTTNIIYAITFLILHWLYYSISESTRHQGTPGKWIMKIAVTDMHYKRLTFWQSSIRNWAKLASFATLGSGFLGAAFTEQKQALHDVIANCLVLHRKK